MTAAADRHLLFGLLALQTGMIDQSQLMIAFQAWTRDKSRSLSEYLEARGDLNAAKRAALEALAAVHVETHGGDVEKSLAAVPANRSARASLAELREPEIEAMLARVARAKNGQATEVDGDDDPDRTAGLSLGAATSDGQRFRILRPHARGGLGEVFVALDGELHREVALKQILDKHADDPASRERFVAEAEITGGLEHPGIVPVYGLGTYAGGRPYYAMRFIKGESLKQAIEAFHRRANINSPSPLVGDGGDLLPPRGGGLRWGAPPPRGGGLRWGAPPQGGGAADAPAGSRDLALRKLLRRFLDVCNAIDYAHSRGVIHRDLKPANIILGKHGETLVVDWGLAKAVGRADPSVGEQTIAPSSSGGSETLPGSALGTPAYMSPEQAAGDLDRLSPRSDVYSLGATLYCLLTGKPPFEGEDVGEIIRNVQAGEFLAPRAVNPSLDNALEAVCKKAMATKPADRYASCRALAEDVERWAADEPVTAYREPLARRARRWAKRNQTPVASAAVALLAGVVGLSAVLVVQTQAKADIARALLHETQARTELAAANTKVQARYELAEKAIKTFHTGVSEDMLLKNEQLKELRTKLLHEAAGFYADLEKLLAGQTDAKSRKALAAAYFQLGELTDKIGDKNEALAVHRKALAVRRELAAAPGTDLETRLDVPRSLEKVGRLLTATGDNAEALATHEEQRELAERLEAEDPTDAVRAILAQSHHSIAFVHHSTGKPALALEANQKALAIRQKLALANPAVTQFQSDLASSHNIIGLVLRDTGRPAEALEASQKALAIRQKLALANPAVTQFQSDLAGSHGNTGNVLRDTGKLAEALPEFQKALGIFQKLVDANPAVTDFQRRLAASHGNMGIILSVTGKPTESLEEYRKALDVFQKLADANPAVTEFQSDLDQVHQTIADALSDTGKPADALMEYQQALAIRQKLVDANPADPEFQTQLARVHNQIGRLHAREKRFTEAFAARDRGLATRQQLADAHPTMTPYTNSLGESHADRGWAHLRAGHAALAAADLRRALALWEKGQAANSEIRFERARALALLAGLAADGKSGVTTAAAAAFADQAIAALRDDLPAERKEWAELNEPDFDALRGREDFKKLLAEVEAKSGPKSQK